MLTKSEHVVGHGEVNHLVHLDVRQRDLCQLLNELSLGDVVHLQTQVYVRVAHEQVELLQPLLFEDQVVRGVSGLSEELLDRPVPCTAFADERTAQS